MISTAWCPVGPGPFTSAGLESAILASLDDSPLGVLEELEGGFGACAGPFGAVEIPVGGMVPPTVAMPFVRAMSELGYAGAVPLSCPGSAEGPAAAFAALLVESPLARASFEAQVHGRLVGIDPALGRVLVERGAMAGIGGLATLSALGALGPIAGFPAFLERGLESVGRGLGGPGAIANNAPGAEIAHQAQVSSVLGDPSLTVEDRVMLMLMLITKKMDQDIQRQSEYISQIQGEQANRQKAGQMLSLAGTVAGAAIGSAVPGLGTKMGAKLGGMVGQMAGGAAQSGAPSVDLETKKLERLVQKRSQMFEMLKGIMEKYDQTAKGVLQSLGR